MLPRADGSTTDAALSDNTAAHYCASLRTSCKSSKFPPISSLHTALISYSNHLCCSHIAHGVLTVGRSHPAPLSHSLLPHCLTLPRPHTDQLFWLTESESVLYYIAEALRLHHCCILCCCPCCYLLCCCGLCYPLCCCPLC